MIRLLYFFLAIFPFSSFSAILVEGKFEAHKVCPLYLSKNKKTNPDGLQIKPSELYEIKEVNRPDNPDWLRLKIPNIKDSLRWVSADCGEYSYDSKGKVSCDQLPDLADSYILALSWQPGFCQTYGYEAGKPECKNLKPNSFQASHLVLHGLWPNQQICGENYGFCGTKPLKNHCDYPSLNLNDEVAQDLRKFMPSFAAGSCLERHEWNKHGSCQVLSSSAYFSLAMRLNNELNESALGQFIHQHIGEKIKREELRKMVVQSFGTNTDHRVYLGCKNGMLVDVWIQLPALIPFQESLVSLVDKAPDFVRYDACPTNIMISDFSSDSWF